MDKQEEKTGLLPETFEIREPHRSQRRRHVVRTAVISLVLLGWWSFYAIPELFDLWRPSKTTFSGSLNTQFLDWEDITPSEKLEWHPCFGQPFQCARLTVPMDYHRPLSASKDNPKVHIAMVLIPGTHSGPNKFSQSPLILNPGGPGGSGTFFALGVGQNIHQVVGEEQDVIGFDPRGVAGTTPRADCFAYPSERSQSIDEEDYVGGNFQRMLWYQAGREIGNVNSSSAALQKLDVRARALAQLCENKDSIDDKESILRYLHTPSVARDMITIIDAWDEWTETLASKIPPADVTVDPNAKGLDEDIEGPGISDTKGKLVYWGFSYGTLLGATFALMFPDRVGRIVLDGVIDATHYIKPIWSDSIRDADAVFDSFSTYCHRAGFGCDLYREGDEVGDITDRFQGVLENLKDNPITTIEPATKTPVIITYSDVRRFIFSTLYAPSATFPILANIANFIYRGKGEIIGSLLSLPYIHELKSTCEPLFPSWLYANEAQNAIMCSDKRYPLNETLPNLERRFEKVSNYSSWGDVWFTLMIGCEGWRVEAVDPPMRWDDHPMHKEKPIKTAHPILFISNTADPVTPLYAGVKMAKKFIGAGLIEQQSEGHCSLAAVSKCTINKIRTYFATGEAPPPPVGNGGERSDGNWTKCEADEWPFHPYDGSEYLVQGGTAIDARRMTASKAMQETFRKIRFWGQQAPLDDGLKRLQLRFQKLKL